MGQLDEHNKQQPFREHVAELRRTFAFCLFYVVAGSTIGYLIYQPIFDILIKPYNEQLYFTTPTGAINAIFKVAILFGITVSIPLLVHRLYKFIKPAIASRAHFVSAKLLLLSAFLAATGVAFGYYVCLPATLHFLTTAGPSGIKAIIDVNSYINFVVNYLVILAVIFQLPLIALIINKIKPLKPSKMMKYQKYVFAAGFIVSALISPTFDPLNLSLLALPVILLYQLAVGMIWLSNRNMKNPEASYAPVDYQPVITEPSSSSVPIQTVTVEAVENSAQLVNRSVPSMPKYPKDGIIMDIFPHRS